MLTYVPIGATWTGLTEPPRYLPQAFASTYDSPGPKELSLRTARLFPAETPQPAVAFPLEKRPIGATPTTVPVGRDSRARLRMPLADGKLAQMPLNQARGEVRARCTEGNSAQAAAAAAAAPVPRFRGHAEHGRETEGHAGVVCTRQASRRANTRFDSPAYCLHGHRPDSGTLIPRATVPM